VKKLGKYEIVRKLGSGATSTVYLCADPFTTRRVAVKLFHPEALRDESSARIHRKLFLTEASLVGRLSHPHIVTIYDAVADEDNTYIVMEYVEGGTLEKVSEVDRLLPLPQIVEIGFKCCKALDYAFRHGVIHRDIKPANILMAGETDIKISDFGAAVVTQAQQTTMVAHVGSPAFMSPQQIKEHPLTHQTDIYSLGVVLYKLLSGRLPFETTSNYNLIYQILNVEPPPPSDFRPEIPASLDRIVRRAMQKDLDQRYKYWEEMAGDLVGVFGTIEWSGAMLSESEKFDILRRLKFFRDFSDVQLWQVLRLTAWRRFPKDSAILREDESGDAFFIIARGRVQVTKQQRLLTVLNVGDSFGEMSYLAKEQQFRRTASVAAAEDDVIAIEINGEMLAGTEEAIRQQFNSAFLGILVNRLAAANLRLSGLLAERNVTIY